MTDAIGERRHGDSLVPAGGTVVAHRPRASDHRRPSLPRGRPVRRPAPAIRFWLAVAASLATAAPAHAYRVDYSSERDPALRPCDAQFWTGHQTAAANCFAELVQSHADPAVQAEAAWAMDDVRLANRLFSEANKRTPGNPHLLTRWGYLHLQTWQDQDAIDLFREALAADEDYQNARIGIAAAITSQFGGAAGVDIEDILEDNAEHPEALLISAGIALETRDFGEARRQLTAALERLPEHVPPLEIYALLAAADYLEGTAGALPGTGASPWIERALEKNPAYGDLFVTLAYYAEITYQYREAVQLLQQAAQMEPQNWRARAALGVNLTRLNRVEEARGHLEAAYRGDPFNPETVNMLRLLDTFGEYVSKPSTLSYRTRDGEHRAEVVLHLHRDEAAVLEPYALDLISRAIPVFAERYQFHPKEPIIIEIYPNHDDFAVRTVGTPGVGLLGVAFGYLFAMDSPTGRASGDFHWGTTLWHELAHVFTLEVSANRIPRWFSEGLSVFEEWESGPIPEIQFRDFVFQAINEDLLLPVTDLDSGFIRPTYENQVVVSYVQAGLICEFIAGRWGDEALARMLQHFKARASTAETIEAVLAIEAKRFDTDFNAYVHDKFKPILENYDYWLKLQQTLREAAQSEDWEAVIRLAKDSLEIYPNHSEASSAYTFLAAAYRETEQADAELETLQRFFDYAGYEPRMLGRLAELLDERDKPIEARRVREALRWVAPQREELHRSLAQDYRRARDYPMALREYDILLGMGAHDKASVHLGMANTYLDSGDAERARRHVLMALEIAPYYREAQDLLLKLSNRDSS